MKVLDAVSRTIEVGCKGTEVTLEGAYHGAATLTGLIKEERKVQHLRCKMKTQQTLDEFEALGFDRSIAEAEIAAIDAELS